jgi:hypothetical protein
MESKIFWKLYLKKLIRTAPAKTIRIININITPLTKHYPVDQYYGLRQPNNDRYLLLKRRKDYENPADFRHPRKL